MALFVYERVSKNCLLYLFEFFVEPGAKEIPDKLALSFLVLQE
jgi:hypothetical protein